MEYDLPGFGDVDRNLEYVNLGVAVVTNIACIYVFLVMWHWWWRLRVSSTNLRPLILGIAFAKFGIWIWSLTGVLQVLVWGVDLPVMTLPGRVFIMLGLLMHVYVTTRIDPTPREQSIPGPFRPR